MKDKKTVELNEEQLTKVTGGEGEQQEYTIEYCTNCGYELNCYPVGITFPLNRLCPKCRTLSVQIKTEYR